MFVTKAHMRVRGQCSIEVRSFLAVASSLALISSAFGQAVQPEVGREVSRIQRPTLFPTPIGRDEERALARELRATQGIRRAESPLRLTSPAMVHTANLFWSLLHYERRAASR